ncbi:MAG: thioredoxin family protein [Candidatus Eisenbacteria bacterium]|nr:thioredoxin family protein [Candidatus Eisenbacteria bacterium]
MKHQRLVSILLFAVLLFLAVTYARERARRGEGAEGATAVEAPARETLPSLVDLGSDKCIPCQKMAPILEELRGVYAGRAEVRFIDVRIDPEEGRRHGVRVIPTQIFFDREGNEVWRHEGFLSKEEIVARFAEMGVE